MAYYGSGHIFRSGEGSWDSCRGFLYLARCYDNNLACGLGFSAGLAVRLLKQVKQAILNAMQRKLKALLMTIVISAAGSLESRNATEPEARNTP